MSKKTKRGNSSMYNHVLRMIHNVQREDVVANTRTISNYRIADSPSQAKLDQIKPSCWVKVYDNYETFWV